ncbi:MAG: hypothetical protein BWX78_01328 [Firmicutes bacterium ADurb.Bin099]|nr:MAG: hypothetical protein BWX78_01328 [Firmicutes bacterium ADurb.Bin099]HPY97774.1 IreB family regulatory phosphoprotein [Clostridia bacterium]HQC67664.1 IreB family regulatory phosphoprotein [Clostridia bacterium]
MDRGSTINLDFLKGHHAETREILTLVFTSMTEKGYDPVNQLVAYLMSGDPTYITSHNGARNAIRKLERDEIMTELIQYYFASK